MPLRKIKVFDSSEVGDRGSNASAMEDLFSPLIVLLRLFGSHSTLLQKYREGNTKDVTCKNVLHFLYCAFLITSQWLNIVREVFQINAEIQHGLTAGLSTILYGTCIVLTSCFHATMSLWTLSRELRKTVTLLMEYEREFGLSFDTMKLKQRVVVINTLLYSFCLLGAISFPFILTLLSNDSYFVRNFIASDYGSSQPSERPAYLFPIVSFNLFLGWGLGICFINVYVLLCHVVCKEVNGFQESFVLATKTQTSEIDIQRLRMRFERIVRILQQINTCIYHCPPTIISGCLVMICLLLYGLVQGQMLVEDEIISSGFLLMVMLLASLMIGFGILTNEKMHAPLETLYSLDLDKMSEKAGIQVSVFINRLSTRPLGISVYGFLVIEKSTILMMFGTVLTYFVVMIQMNPSNAAQCDLQSILDMLNSTKS